MDAVIASPTLFSTADRLGDLFDLHHQRLYRLARRMSGNAEEAHDLVQESFLRAARSIRRVPTTEKGAEAWLVRTLVNLCRDGYRRAEVRKRAAETVLAVDDAVVDSENRWVARTAVRDALAALDARRRSVVVLHELEERPMREVARLLGIAPVTARWHLAKARRQLADVLGTVREEIEP
ncbi:MAG: sigma-70 family RNA polymerase sigma factor [Acidobacteriota bacterium]